jgi:hypothetical protein
MFNLKPPRHISTLPVAAMEGDMVIGPKVPQGDVTVPKRTANSAT